MADVKEQVNAAGRELTNKGLKFEYQDGNEKPVIALNFGGGDFSYTHVRILVIFDLDGESAQVATAPIASAPLEKTSQVLFALNQCNERFRWVKFYLDSDNDIIANADVIFNETNAGPVVHEIVGRMASIIDDAYADIMKAIWS